MKPRHWLAIFCIASLVGSVKVEAQAWDSVQLEWQIPSACTSGQPIANCIVTAYRVEHAISQTGTFAALGTSQTNTYTHVGAAPGLHCYRVIATSSKGDSVPSNVACKTVVQPSGPPNPPTNLKVVETVAYNVVPNYQRFAFERGKRAGTIKVGAACDESRVTTDGYYAISRPSRVEPKPKEGTVLVARCG